MAAAATGETRLYAAKRASLNTAFNAAVGAIAHPERFVSGTPVPPHLPTAAWINKPKTIDGSVTSRV